MNRARSQSVGANCGTSSAPAHECETARSSAKPWIKCEVGVRRAMNCAEDEGCRVWADTGRIPYRRTRTLGLCSIRRRTSSEMTTARPARSVSLALASRWVQNRAERRGEPQTTSRTVRRFSSAPRPGRGPTCVSIDSSSSRCCDRKPPVPVRARRCPTPGARGMPRP
jgi:hypothetical protein